MSLNARITRRPRGNLGAPNPPAADDALESVPGAVGARTAGLRLTSTSRPRSPMFARLSIYENVDLDLADQVTHWVETTETDPFRGLPGYRGSMTLVDRDNARVVGIGFYASAAQAREAETLLTTLYEQNRAQVPEPIRPALEMRPESVGLYEIVHRD